MYFKKYKFPLQSDSDRIQKISINSGFSCPNRDGSKGKGGCTFCNNDAFIPYYASQESNITSQINKGIDFFSRKYGTSKFLAYFQAYTNTNSSLENIKKIYKPIVDDERFLGIVVGTRPDCISEEILKYFSEIKSEKYVKLEFGVETFNDETLIKCNRGHTAEDSVNAINLTSKYNIPIGVHLILGLPGDSNSSIIANSKMISKLNVESIKLHHLQIMEGTKLAEEYKNNPDSIKLFTAASYIKLVVDFLEYLNPKIAIERLINEIPPKYLIAPKWGGLRTSDIYRLVEEEFRKRNSHQGIKFNY